MKDVVMPGPAAEPVFVLCGGRSGSTLLRFLLDSHSLLACPPETNLPGIAAQLATVWSLIEGAPLSAERGDQPPEIPEAAIDGVRRAMDEMIGSYLARRGKQRYCDKSLGTAPSAELLLRIYPEAKFVCLYRHPMDMIASGIEACPWGLNGYGFDPYITGTPGNAVLALARYWVDNTAAVLAAERRFPASCLRVRYEDLVADPEDTAARLFQFLEVPPEPGISARCLLAGRERFGPADYKIWHTAQITRDSVGRGWTIPAGMIPEAIAAQVNQLTGELGYLPVDGAWGTAVLPADMRMTGASPAGLSRDGTRPPRLTVLAGRLTDGLSRVDHRFVRRWASCGAESFTVVATVSPGAAPRGEGRWLVDLATRSLTELTGPVSDGDETGWDVVGSAEAWHAVLTGRVNLGVAMRRCELRYCESSQPGPVAADARIGMLADLLGLNPGQRPQVGEHRAAEAGHQ